MTILIQLFTWYQISISLTAPSILVQMATTNPASSKSSLLLNASITFKLSQSVHVSILSALRNFTAIYLLMMTIFVAKLCKTTYKSLQPILQEPSIPSNKMAFYQRHLTDMPTLSLNRCRQMRRFLVDKVINHARIVVSTHVVTSHHQDASTAFSLVT